MVLQPPPLMLLWAVLENLVPVGLCGSSRHSLCYSYLKVSEPSQGLSQFLSMVHLDDHPIARYDILNGKTVSLVPWMEVEEMKAPERMFRADLEQLSELNHQTEGLHTWQMDLGCELREDGSKRGFLHYGYSGMDFISFDKETLRWVAAHPQAQKVKETWEDDSRRSQGNKDFLEEICIEWLQRYLSYQKVKKTEPPVGKVTHKVVHDKLEVLICQAFGFYPKEIQSIWTKDGEACKYETLHRNVAPNSDGTYFVQLSIEINPKERDHFQCHLEHEGLQDPLVLAFKQEADTISFIFIGIGIMITCALVILFVICYGLKYRKNLHQEKTICHDHLLSSTTSGTKDENHSVTMPSPKMTSEDCCGQKTELKGREKTPLLAYPNACSDHEEGPSLETSEWGLEEHLEDAEATKPGMEEQSSNYDPGAGCGPLRPFIRPASESVGLEKPRQTSPAVSRDHGNVPCKACCCTHKKQPPMQSFPRPHWGAGHRSWDGERQRKCGEVLHQ